MPDLPRPALQVIEITPPEEPGAPRQDGTAPQPSAPAEGARGDHEGWEIYRRFPKVGELVAGRGPHG